MLENSSIVEERRRVCLRERTPYLAQINIRIKKFYCWNCMWVKKLGFKIFWYYCGEYSIRFYHTLKKIGCKPWKGMIPYVAKLLLTLLSPSENFEKYFRKNYRLSVYNYFKRVVCIFDWFIARSKQVHITWKCKILTVYVPFSQTNMFLSIAH